MTFNSITRNEGQYPMRMTLAAPALTLLLALSGCAGSGAEDLNEPGRVCAEQSAWAQSGRTDGRDITITCP